MSKLQAALAWAARGFPVFPLAPNSKLPALGDAWYDYATTDADTIRRMWTDPVMRTERDYNIGVDCSDMIVVDIDVKEGKDGFNQYMQLGGTFDSLTVQTPTGGYHVYFHGEAVANVNIAKDIEIRSHHGYVVAPGSTINGEEYRVLYDEPVAWVPYEVDKLTQSVYKRREVQYTGELDTPAAIQGAINYLLSTPPAIEGQRGDETTFITAARLVRELGLTVETAYGLMAEYYNPRCEPPWQLDELYAKVENAANYGTADLAKLEPSVLFAGASGLTPPPSFTERLMTTVSEVGLWGNAILPEVIPPRPWLVDRLLMIGDITLLLAPGSAGKSSLGLAIAAHLAVGIPFGPYKTNAKCKSIVYNGEDDVHEQSRRLLAVCLAYGLDYNMVRQNIMLLDPTIIDMKLVTAPGKLAVVQNEMVDAIVNLASDSDIGLLIVDPLVDIHDCDEGDNPQMNVVVRTLKDVARRANISILAAHHTTKAGSSRQEERVGNMDISRGASSIVYKARIAVTLLNASQQDAEDYGIQDHERHKWVRMDDAKMNLSLADGDPVWFFKEGVRIQSGDAVGVLRYSERRKDTMQLVVRMGEILIETLTANGAGSMPIAQAVSVLRAAEPLLANKSDADVKRRVEGSFATAKEIRGVTIQYVRDETSANKALITLV